MSVRQWMVGGAVRTATALAWGAAAIGAAPPLGAQTGPECAHPDGDVAFGLMGDINGTGAVNVADALCSTIAALSVLAAPLDPQWPSCVSVSPVLLDLNCDGVVTVADTQLVIALATQGALSSTVASGPSGCPDSCSALGEPDCGDGCQNGGECLADDTCVCVGPFTGEHCTELAGFSAIPAGSFTMGSPDGLGEYPIGSGVVAPAELGRAADREGAVSVTLTRPFYMEQTEVTQGDWQAVQQWRIAQGLQVAPVTNPSLFADCGQTCPVERVSWWSALAYANALSEADGLVPCYVLPETQPDASPCAGDWIAGTLDCGDQMPSVTAPSGDVYDCAGYRLPTEAEWEYAARAGTTTATYAGNLTTTGCASALHGPIAWFCGNNNWDVSSPQYGIKPVAGRQANPWGLYDMLGNVFEFGWDRFDLAVLTHLGGVDPQRLDSGAVRVARGGAWSNDAEVLRAARRGANYAGNEFVGFRLVITRTP